MSVEAGGDNSAHCAAASRSPRRYSHSAGHVAGKRSRRRAHRGEVVAAGRTEKADRNRSEPEFEEPFAQRTAVVVLALGNGARDQLDLPRRQPQRFVGAGGVFGLRLAVR